MFHNVLDWEHGVIYRVCSPNMGIRNNLYPYLWGRRDLLDQVARLWSEEQGEVCDSPLQQKQKFKLKVYLNLCTKENVDWADMTDDRWQIWKQ